MKYRFFAFKAIENREESLRFQQGHTQVLLDLGIENLSSNEPRWLTDPNVIVISITDSDGDIVGGLRIHKYTGEYSLPVIDALSYLDTKIKGVFEASLPAGTAEICGLWSARKVFGRGLSAPLCRGALAVVDLIGLKDFYCFSAPYTEKMIRGMGCREVSEIGDNGRFLYPNEKFISTVLYCPDVKTLELAEELNRQLVFNIVKFPNLTFEEIGPRGSFYVEYCLHYELCKPEI